LILMMIIIGIMPTTCSCRRDHRRSSTGWMVPPQEVPYQTVWQIAVNALKWDGRRGALKKDCAAFR
jgi:hypothetical protein